MIAAMAQTKHVELEIVSRSSAERTLFGSDFRVGRILLAAHLRASGVASIDVDRKFARQLMLREPSNFASGRVPLFVCECCADLGCGALTVSVHHEGDRVVWSDFAYEGLDESALSGSEDVARTGPFSFDRALYDSALSPYR